jgi:hypothetical protein
MRLPQRASLLGARISTKLERRKSAAPRRFRPLGPKKPDEILLSFGAPTQAALSREDRCPARRSLKFLTFVGAPAITAA